MCLCSYLLVIVPVYLPLLACYSNSLRVISNAECLLVDQVNWILKDLMTEQRMLYSSQDMTESFMALPYVTGVPRIV